MYENSHRCIARARSAANEAAEAEAVAEAVADENDSGRIFGGSVPKPMPPPNLLLLLLLLVCVTRFAA